MLDGHRATNRWIKAGLYKMNEFGSTVPCNRNLALKVMISLHGKFHTFNTDPFPTSKRLPINQYAVLCEFAYFGI